MKKTQFTSSLLALLLAQGAFALDAAAMKALVDSLNGIRSAIGAKSATEAGLECNRLPGLLSASPDLASTAAVQTAKSDVEKACSDRIRAAVATEIQQIDASFVNGSPESPLCGGYENGAHGSYYPIIQPGIEACRKSHIRRDAAICSAASGALAAAKNLGSPADIVAQFNATALSNLGRCLQLKYSDGAFAAAKSSAQDAASQAVERCIVQIGVIRQTAAAGSKKTCSALGPSPLAAFVDLARQRDAESAYQAAKTACGS